MLRSLLLTSKIYITISRVFMNRLRTLLRSLLSDLLMVPPVCAACSMLFIVYTVMHFNRGWRGSVHILRLGPRLTGSCLDLASPTRVATYRNFAAFTCSMSAGRTLPFLAGIACNNTNTNTSAPLSRPGLLGRPTRGQ
jgi:hypothetical protein